MGWDMAAWGESAVQEKNLGKTVTDCAGLVPEGPPCNTEVQEPVTRIQGIVMSVLDSCRYQELK